MIAKPSGLIERDVCRSQDDDSMSRLRDASTEDVSSMAQNVPDDASQQLQSERFTAVRFGSVGPTKNNDSGKE